MRKVLGVVIALALASSAAITPASAEPANASAAYAYGLQATGLIPIGPLVEAGPVVQPPSPADTVVPSTLLTVPLSTVALSGTAVADAHAHQADDLPVILGAVPVAPGFSDPTTITGVNAQSSAATDQLALLFEDPAGGGDPATLLLRTLLSTAVGGLLSADAVVAEAVAKCVNNQPVYETGYLIAGLGGLLGDLLEGVVNPLLETILPLLGEGGLLGAVINIEPGVVTPLDNGIAIDALRINVPLLGDETIVVSHAEAYVPPGCSVAPPATIPPTGPGPVAPTARLAVTGGDMPFVPMALVLLGSALVLRRIVRKRPEASSIG